MNKNKIFNYVLAIALTAFALLTMFLSSSVLFDWFGIRAKEGSYVPFIVWINFICSVLYLIAVYGFIKFKKWTFKVLIVSVLILIIALVSLYFYIDAGGLYEAKTIGALIFRIVVSIVFALLAYWRITKET